jgi:hypothetical protein
MYYEGDRVYIKDTGNLISIVRGQYGYIRKVSTPWMAHRSERLSYSLDIELDNGARPTGRPSGFYTFNDKYVELVTPQEPDWEI